MRTSLNVSLDIADSQKIQKYCKSKDIKISHFMCSSALEKIGADSDGD